MTAENAVGPASTYTPVATTTEVEGLGFARVRPADSRGWRADVHGVRYADSGGLSPVARAARESVRFEAAGMFAEGLSTDEIATRLRVTPKSVRVWRRRWRLEGEAALLPKGPGGASC